MYVEIIPGKWSIETFKKTAILGNITYKKGKCYKLKLKPGCWGESFVREEIYQ
jgi:hypothetical protein